MPPSNQVWYLMARSLSGEATLPEEQELRQLLQNDFSLQQQYDLLQRLWQNPGGSLHNTDCIAEKEYKSIRRIVHLAESDQYLSNEKQRKFGSRRRREIFYVSGLSAVILTAILFFTRQTKSLNNSVEQPGTQVLAAQNGTRSKTILPDGSTVWLNAGSKIYYNKDFSGKLREVRLEGEAFFDVQKNAQKPFIVHTSGIDIKVLGTAFNVKSYPSDKTVETTLLRGLVQVTRDNNADQQPILLHPNEKIIITKKVGAADAGILEKIPENTEKYAPIIFTITHLDSTSNKEQPIETAWINNRLIFRGESFEELAVKLERWYNVSVIFEDEKTKQLNFTGSFENETVEQAFSALKTAVSFNYRIKDNKVYISSEGELQMN